MGLIFRALPILPGEARGPLLVLAEPLSFWGGVDPRTGRITDPGCGAQGCIITGTVLAFPATRGSSSASAVLLQLLHAGLAPAALVLGAIDAILGLGILVAQEMGWPTIPLLLLPREAQADLVTGVVVSIARDGTIADEEQAREVDREEQWRQAAAPKRP